MFCLKQFSWLEATVYYAVFVYYKFIFNIIFYFQFITQLLHNIVIFFISYLNSHSDGTHSLQKLHWWASDVVTFLQICSGEETNSFTSWMANTVCLQNVHTNNNAFTSLYWTLKRLMENTTVSVPSL